MVTATQLLLLEKENSILFKFMAAWRSGNATGFDPVMSRLDPYSGRHI